MIKLNSIEKRLEYHELLMTLDNLTQIPKYDLPNGYSFVYYNNSLHDWVQIHIESGEFISVEYAESVFEDFYKSFKSELDKRCIFVVDNATNQKVATATISPCNEYGYTAKIDWLAISKKYQGKHLARPLLSRTLSIAQSLGYNRILLHTQTHTWLAVKIYLDFGFEPLNILESMRGWQIIKTITKHPKLESLKVIPEQTMYHEPSENIVAKLNTLHTDYTYEIWFKNGRNDVYVSDGKSYFEYKFYKNGKKLKLTNKDNKRLHY